MQRILGFTTIFIDILKVLSLYYKQFGVLLLAHFYYSKTILPKDKRHCVFLVILKKKNTINYVFDCKTKIVTHKNASPFATSFTFYR